MEKAAEYMATLVKKAYKYDEIEKLVGEFYFDEDGEVIEESDGGSLCDIGEAVVIYFGYF